MMNSFWKQRLLSPAALLFESSRAKVASPPKSASKVALALVTALTLGTSTTLAFATSPTIQKNTQHNNNNNDDDRKTRREFGYFLGAQSNTQSISTTASRSSQWQLGRQPSVQCEAQSTPNNDNDRSSSSKSIEEKDPTGLPAIANLALNDNEAYERMNPPARMDEHSHAVGQLLQPGKIEQYEIYRHKAATATASTQAVTTSPTHTIVTALVRFGASLDGHEGIVHGGIQALVLDDIFGCSFHAIGVPMAVTANLSLDYRAALPANTNVAIHISLKKRDNRKLYFKADVVSLDGKVLYTEATCLYIIPRSVWAKLVEENYTEQ